MSRKFIEEKIEKITYILEMFISVLLALGVTIGLVDLVKYFSEILFASPAETYDIFQSFLGYALLLIVGIELILMIIHHSTRSILELVLFVIARKMLIYSQTMMDLVLGTLAIALVFVILRYLIPNGGKDIVKRENYSYSASINMKDVLSDTGSDNTAGENFTIGSYISDLAAAEDKPIEEGAEYRVGDIKIKVTKITDEGQVKEIIVTDNKSEKNNRRMFRH